MQGLAAQTETFNKMTAEKIKVKTKKNELIEESMRVEELKILAMDLSGMDEERRRVFHNVQQDLLKKYSS